MGGGGRAGILINTVGGGGYIQLTLSYHQIVFYSNEEKYQDSRILLQNIVYVHNIHRAVLECFATADFIKKVLSV